MSEDRRGIVRVAAMLAALAFLSMAFLSPQTIRNWQVISRLAMVAAIAERGELNIDRFAARTGDRGAFGGHSYSDKPPGHPLLAVVPVAVVHAVLSAAGNTAPADADDHVLRLYNAAAVISVNVLLSALGVAFLYLAAIRLGAGDAAALFAAIAFGFATPFFGWSTAFFGHSVSASLIAILLYRVAGAATGGGSATFTGAGATGLLGGATVSVDFTAAPAVACLGLVPVFAALRRAGAGGALRTMLGLAAGGLIGMLPIFVINALCFGGPLSFGYARSTFTGMQTHFFGIALPDPKILSRLLFGLHRGLLPLSPVLVLAPIGLARMLRAAPTRGVALAAIGGALAFLLINAGFVYWSGGWSTGPRYLVPMLPLVALPLAFVWRRPFYSVAAVLLALSAGISLVCASVSMFVPERVDVPFFDYLLPTFIAGWSHRLDLAMMIPVWAILAWNLARETRAALHGREVPAA